MKIYDITIIGGGASGMLAAIMARRQGKKACLIERNAKLGKKILLTGNGRCNISNENVVEDCKSPVHYHGKNPKFVLSPLNRFGLKETKKFFKELGIEFLEEDNGRLFPASNQAQSVVDVLEYELQKLHTKILFKSKVLRIEQDDGIFVIAVDNGGEILSKKLVIATGGKTFPGTGSTGDGYDIARQFGHKIIDTFPAYTGLLTKSPILQKLQGVKLEVEVTLMTEPVTLSARLSNGQEVEGSGESKNYHGSTLLRQAQDRQLTMTVLAKNSGTIMFAHYGLSAPAILEISRLASEEIEKGHKVNILVNFLPNIKEHELEKFIQDRWDKSPNKSLGFSFVGLLPRKVFPALLETQQIDPEMKVAEVDKELRKKITKILHAYELEILGTRGFEDAHFTAGGVDTKEVDPRTLESKLKKGLYLCGEILDIDGDCGGYNLQWAWSSGAICGLMD